ncbi:hypothetical protein [Parapedobacter sp.]|uniref:hypothetical protein n=1 Tax=Parapedobacter sp. TaxID=1958893 RepID=UPI002D7E67F1|nr:hypothetical protein [Parapedobacter sp.]
MGNIFWPSLPEEASVSKEDIRKAEEGDHYRILPGQKNSGELCPHMGMSIVMNMNIKIFEQ